MMMESTDEYLVKEAEFLRNVYSEFAPVPASRLEKS